MLVICAGLQKSGSALCFNIINELLISSGFADIRKIRREYQLEDIVIQDDCYVHELNLQNFKRVLAPLRDGNSIVIKTHFFPKRDYFEYVKDNVLGFDIKYIYTYRDPRDVVLSTLDHREKDPSTFDDFDTFENALVASVPLFEEALKWQSFKQAKLIRYEEFNEGTAFLTNTVQQFLDIPPKPDDAAINDRFSKHNIESWDDNTKKFGRLHFNKGISSRYLSELNNSKLSLVESYLGYYIDKFGYTMMTDRVDKSPTNVSIELTEFLGSIRTKDALIGSLVEHLTALEMQIREKAKNNASLQARLDDLSLEVAAQNQSFSDNRNLVDQNTRQQDAIEKLTHDHENQLAITNSLIDQVDSIKSSYTYRILRMVSTPFFLFRKRS